MYTPLLLTAFKMNRLLRTTLMLCIAEYAQGGNSVTTEQRGLDSFGWAGSFQIDYLILPQLYYITIVKR